MQNWHRKSDNSGGKVRRRDSVFPQEPKDVFRDFLRVHVHGEVLEREVQVLGHSGVDKPLVVLRRRPGRQCYKTFFLRHWRGCQKARMFVPPVFQACLLLFVTKAEEFQSYGQRSGQIIRLAGKTWRCQISLFGSFSDRKRLVYSVWTRGSGLERAGSPSSAANGESFRRTGIRVTELFLSVNNTPDEKS